MPQRAEAKNPARHLDALATHARATRAAPPQIINKAPPPSTAIAKNHNIHTTIEIAPLI